MAKKILEWPDESVLKELILKILSQQDQPQTAKDFRKQLAASFKIPEDRLLELLTNLVVLRNVFEWPAKGKGAKRFWKEPPSPEFISQKIVQSLSDKPLTSLELKKVLSKQLFGLPQKAVDPVIHSLLLRGTIIQHPKIVGLKAKLGQRPPDPKPYLHKVLKELDQVAKMLAPSQVSREEIHQALLGLIGASGHRVVSLGEPKTVDFEEQILSKMIEVEPQAPYGALVSLRNVRRALDLEKGLFDLTIIGLAKKGRIVLHQHSFPRGLAEEERNALVDDQKGHWYVGAVIMEK
ncbi:MAG: hypothetical protein C0407_12150 [Desulfobacca sp.]|nr:hypothetical protein [Desulfobacca sp.]